MGIFDFFDKDEKKGRGYVGYSKSVNATNAEEEGKYPATQIAKLTKTEAKWVKETFNPTEWHHTSKHFNKTNYYDLDEVKAFLKENPTHFKKWKEKEKGMKPVVRKAKEVKWLEWSGSRARPKVTERIAKNVKVTYNGKDTYTFKVGNETISKRSSTKGFEIVWQPTKEQATAQKSEKEKMKKAYLEMFKKKELFKLPASIKKTKTGQAWAAIKNGKLVDVIFMNAYGGLTEFEDFRKESREKLAKKGEVKAGTVKYSQMFKMYYFEPKK